MTKKDQEKEKSITEKELKKEFKLLKEKGAQLKKDLEILEKRRNGAGIGLQDEGSKGGIKEELETLELVGRTISIASSSLSRVSNSLHSAAVEITKDGMAIKDLLDKSPKAAKEYKRILENVKNIYSKEEKAGTPEDTLDALSNLLDRYLEGLEKELEEKKAPAVTKKPAPKPEEAPEAAPPDYNSMKWGDLQKLASNRGLKVIGPGVKKSKVIADLKAMDKGEVVAPAEEKKAPAVTKKPAPKPEEAPEAAPLDYKSMKWTDLQKLAGKRGLEVIGVKKDKVIADLKAMDKGEVVAPAEEKKAPKVEKPEEETKKEKVMALSSTEKIKLIEEKRKEKIEEAIAREKAEKKAKAPPKKPVAKAKAKPKKPAKKKAPAVTKK